MCGGFIGDIVSGISDVVSDVVDAGVGLVNSIPGVGDFADDVLGLDPNGHGIVPALKTVGNIAATSLLGGAAVDALGSAFGGWGGGASALGEGVQVFDDGSQLFTGSNGAITGGVDSAGNAFDFSNGTASYTGGGALGGAAETNFGGSLADVSDVNALTNPTTPGLLDNVSASDVSNAAKVGNSLLGGGGGAPATGALGSAIKGATGATGATGGSVASGLLGGGATAGNLGLLSLLSQQNQDSAEPAPISYAAIQPFKN